VAASIQCFEFGGTRPPAAQIAPLNIVGRYAGVLGHIDRSFNYS